MDDDQRLERLVKENLRITKENNRRIRSIQRGMFFSGIVRIAIWALILGIPVLIYFSVLKPYIDEASSTFESIRSGETSVFEQIINVPSIDILQNALEDHQAAE